MIKTFTSLRGLDWSHIRLSYVAPLYLNRPNSEQVLSIFDDYSKLPAEILDRVLFVLVDDGSPQAYTLKDWPLNMIVLRVGEDIPWNNPGARNLGVLYAKSDKVFVTDIDHQLDSVSFRKLLDLRAPARNLWRLPRFSHDGKKLRAHANTFLLSRGMFMKYFGYDEELCGSYACDDTLFVKYLKYHGMRLSTLSNGARATVRFIKNFEDQPYTHTLSRDKTRNKAIVARKLKDIWTFGKNAGHSHQFLNFEWKVVRVTRREVPPQKEDKLWALGWWGRWFTGER
jgi:hypothetical protein